MSDVPRPEEPTRRLRDLMRTAALPMDDLAPFFSEGLVVVDANVLLGLYTVTKSARQEQLTVLKIVSARLWIPNQVAVEFMNHRADILVQRRKALADASRDLERIAQTISENIETASAIVEKLRETGATSVPWDRATHEP